MNMLLALSISACIFGLPRPVQIVLRDFDITPIAPQPVTEIIVTPAQGTLLIQDPKVPFKYRHRRWYRLYQRLIQHG